MKNKIAIVTGALGGIGKCTVKKLQSEGFSVVAIDRVDNDNWSDGDVEPTLYLNKEVKCHSSAQDVLLAVRELSDSVDLLVNMAGSFYTDDEIDQTPSLALDLWSDNFLSTYHMSNAFIPLLQKATTPMIVNIGSTDAIVASAGQHCELGVCHDTYYSSTKGAVVTFSRCLAMKLAKKNIRVNVVCPTIVRTAMADSLLSIDNKEAELSEAIPLGRICEPVDVADAISSLYGMKMCTGHMLPVDGGYLCK